MTTIVHHPRTRAPLADRGVGERFVIVWTCTRRMRSDAASARRLEQSRFMLAVEPLDVHHAMVEAWIESRGERLRSVLDARCCRCSITCDEAAGLMHMDAAHEGNGGRLFALTLPLGDERSAPLYVRTALLRQAGFAPGGYDAPTLERAGASAASPVASISAANHNGAG